LPLGYCGTLTSVMVPSDTVSSTWTGPHWVWATSPVTVEADCCVPEEPEEPDEPEEPEEPPDEPPEVEPPDDPAEEPEITAGGLAAEADGPEVDVW